MSRTIRSRCRPRLSTLEDRTLPANFLVTTLADTGTGSLRDAITRANAAGADSITFQVAGTITLATALPTLTDNQTTLDGNTAPGFVDTPRIVLRGPGIGAGQTGPRGLLVRSNNNLIRGLQIDTFGVGIEVQGDANRVSGCFLGTDGTLALPNHTGLLVSAGAASNVIGTNGDGNGDTLERNVISGNTIGVMLTGAGADNNVVAGNRIGTSSTGLAAVPNTTFGVRITGGASFNTIGGDVAAERNVISGNTSHGVSLADAATTDNLIFGNHVGVNAAGTAALGNGGAGIELSNQTTRNAIGLAASARFNVIGGNTLEGVRLSALGNSVNFNFIGTDSTSALDLGNALDGISITTNSNQIHSNTIRNNDGAGILVSAGSGNLLSGNVVAANGGLGIDLGDVGVTPNDAQDADAGANNLQNFPLLTAAVSTSRATRIHGTLNSTPNTIFEIQLFVSADAAPLAVIGRSVGSVTVQTNVLGNATFVIPTSAILAAGTELVATATDANGNTSEFSAAVVVAQAPNLTVADVTVVEGTGGSTTVTFTLTLSAASLAPVEVQYATANGTAVTPADYAESSGVRTFVPGETTQTVTLTVAADALAEANETFFVDLSNVLDANLPDPRGQATITDDDAKGGLGGKVYRDLNNNGTVGANETGIANVRLRLFRTAGGVDVFAGETTTNATGDFSFTGLQPGTYRLSEIQPTAFEDGITRAGTLGGTVTGNDVAGIVVVANVTGTGYNFGERSLSSLSGTVFDDFNNNGRFETDPANNEVGIAGVTVQLFLQTATGTVFVAETTTNASGAYTFPNLRAGTYSVVEVQPITFVDGQERVGTLGGTVGNDTFTDVVLPVATDARNYLFGERKLASLRGSVFDDRNDNGQVDAGEPGIANVTVQLYRVVGAEVETLVAEQLTNSQGVFQFTALHPGVYKLLEVQPATHVDGKDKAGAPNGVAGEDVITDITLSAATVATGYVFGERRFGSLSGTVFHDVNNNAMVDANEGGIAGVAVRLFRQDAGGNTFIAERLTSATGAYSFTNLSPGTYRLVEVQPAGVTDGRERVGSLSGTPGNDVIANIPVAAAAVGTGYTFGELRLSTIRGSVYHDVNNDGVFAPQNGEAGLAGVLVRLFRTDSGQDVFVRELRTDASGTYVFGNLLPGTYKLVEMTPTGFTDGRDRVGSLGGALQGADVIANVVVGANVVGTGYTFGERRTGAAGVAGVSATLSDWVFVTTEFNRGQRRASGMWH